MLKNHPWKTLSYQQVIDTPYLKIRCEQVAVPMVQSSLTITLSKTGAG